MILEPGTWVEIIDPALISIFGDRGQVVSRTFKGTRLLWYNVRIDDQIIPCYTHQIEELNAD